MTFEIINTGGKTYSRPTRLGSSSSAADRRAASQGRWIIAPSTLGALSLTSLTDMTKLFDSLTSSLGTLSKGDTTKVDGQPAINVTSSKGGTLAVATTGQPYPLQLQGSKSNAGTITFDQWDEPVTITAPENPVDFSKLTGG